MYAHHSFHYIFQHSGSIWIIYVYTNHIPILFFHMFPSYSHHLHMIIPSSSHHIPIIFLSSSHDNPIIFSSQSHNFPIIFSSYFDHILYYQIFPTSSHLPSLCRSSHPLGPFRPGPGRHWSAAGSIGHSLRPRPGGGGGAVRLSGRGEIRGVMGHGFMVSIFWDLWYGK